MDTTDCATLSYGFEKEVIIEMKSNPMKNLFIGCILMKIDTHGVVECFDFGVVGHISCLKNWALS